MIHTPFSKKVSVNTSHNQQNYKTINEFKNVKYHYKVTSLQNNMLIKLLSLAALTADVF